VNIIAEHRRKRSLAKQGQAAAIMHGSSNGSKRRDESVITSKSTSPPRSSEDIRRRSSLLMQAALSRTLTVTHSKQANHDSTCQHTPPLLVSWPSTALARLKSQQHHDGCAVLSTDSPYTSLAANDEEDAYEQGRDSAPAASGDADINDENSQCDELLTMLKEADDQLYLDIMWNIHKVELDW
jgi:hypothetical protein